MFKTIDVETGKHNQMIDITDRIAAVVRQSGAQDGLVICYVPHTTAGVTIQENADPDVVQDILYKLAELIPHSDPQFRHDEGNSDAHIKASLMGAATTIILREAEMVLGTWQGIFFCEFDGPRSRKVHVKVVSGG